MMQYVPFQSALEQERITIIKCWQVLRENGKGLNLNEGEQLR